MRYDVVQSQTQGKTLQLGYLARLKLARPSGDHTSTLSAEGMPTWVDTLARTSGDHHSPPSSEGMPTSVWVSVYCYSLEEGDSGSGPHVQGSNVELLVMVDVVVAEVGGWSQTVVVAEGVAVGGGRKAEWQGRRRGVQWRREGRAEQSMERSNGFRSGFSRSRWGRRRRGRGESPRR
ncbi:hypothetical protein QJS04_geneDACA020570 [Acorus gramineus]|uniref:Uncharacterized protein n=1 Tax=Acorus gramineus TaxID=55184 RepID=A0AAV8ZYD6_ACOGR|nr:hypothetical protein QJS04_geneDACA020570 [Acorus gramineus]